MEIYAKSRPLEKCVVWFQVLIIVRYFSQKSKMCELGSVS